MNDTLQRGAILQLNKCMRDIAGAECNGSSCSTHDTTATMTYVVPASHCMAMAKLFGGDVTRRSNFVEPLPSEQHALSGPASLAAPTTLDELKNYLERAINTNLYKTRSTKREDIKRSDLS